eukprot:CAMPEP_0115008226 /NCGR_PEP_ID=MMETSP0216-20121206/21765_1 /TAXON_ID=223996 /ORGANISM="Protocruzia adherens, Strain Boccale" /LENGTH=431 /DNA_ID=CAMNT_0002375551 /DNA_START=43 /DNA_END=1338 /DNA_ORIENTATION=-
MRISSFSKNCLSKRAGMNTLFKVPKRFFDLHEYESKVIMREAGLNVQKGDLASTPEEAFKVSNSLDMSGGLVLKSQVHAGGRGKGHLTSGMQGGVKLCDTAEQVQDLSSKMIGFNLITHQTTKEGLTVNQVLVHEAVDIVDQLYFAILMDRKYNGPVILASKKGGMDIEEVSETDPEAILVHPIDIKEGPQDADLDKLALDLGFEDDSLRSAAVDQIKKLYSMFINLDATQVEVNPWALNPEGKVWCIDAKINIDDNALFRHQRILDMRANSQTSEDVDPNEEKAAKAGLNYIKLDGDWGCIVNGAGLAMATMDLLKLKGKEPANFLDVGGGANEDQIKEAFEILMGNPNVKVIFINIFGGIMRCNIIAQGIVNACKSANLTLPLVVRFNGTNKDQGREILEEFAASRSKNDSPIIFTDDLRTFDFGSVKY